jgi:uroporphyrinogen-III synthase
MDGLRVGVTSARKGAELTEALERRGAIVTWGPTVETVPPESDAQLLDETDVILAANPDWVAGSTGTGLRAWVEAADTHGRGAALRALFEKARIVARGPKAVGAFRALGVRPEFVSPQETDADLAAWLGNHVCASDVVAVQVHGADVGHAYTELERRKVTVLRAAPYRCVLPKDQAPAHQLIDQIVSGEVDVVVSTSAPAASNLVRIAADMGQRESLECALRERVAVAAVGPVTATAFERAGIGVSIMPERFRTGDLIRALDSWNRRRSWAYGDGRRLTGPITLVPDERVARVGDYTAALGEREFALLAALVRRPHIVCRMDLLTRETWGSQAPDDPLHVKHLVFRVRRKLGPSAVTIQTVRGVGYRYDPSACVS